MDFEDKRLSNKEKNSTVINDLFARIQNQNSIYDSAEMFMWEKLEFPGFIKSFYENKLWKTSSNFEAIRFLSFNDMVVENTQMAPGAILSRFGYLTIAITTGGNAIVINFNRNSKHPIYSVAYGDHSVFCDKTYYGRINGQYRDHVLNQDIVDDLIYDPGLSIESFVDNVINGKIDLDEIDYVL